MFRPTTMVSSRDWADNRFSARFGPAHHFGVKGLPWEVSEPTVTKGTT
jgi:hypothetical protein